MAYEFGGVNTCCSNDLGYVINKMGELLKQYDELVNVYNQVVENIDETVLQLFENGVIQLDCEYNKHLQEISFVFINNSVDKNLLNNRG